MAAQPIPRDARLVALIASSMGIQDYESAALVQLLDFAQRYTYDVLQDAMMYSDHAGTSSRGVSGVSLEDVQLAVQSRVNYSFTQPPNKEMLLSLATSLNTVPLPPLSDAVGIRLPPRQHRLTNVNFTIVPNLPPPDLAGGDDVDAREETDREKKNAKGGAPRAIDEDEDYDESEPGGTDDRTGDKPLHGAEAADQGSRGLKRGLEEDEEYD